MSISTSGGQIVAKKARAFPTLTFQAVGENLTFYELGARTIPYIPSKA